MIPAITTWLFNQPLSAGEIDFEAVLDFFVEDLDAQVLERYKDSL